MSALSQPEGHYLEILDLRHFSAAQLRPLLRDEAARWQHRLQWDYTSASNVLLDYLDGRILPGFVALDAARGNRILGYAFCVFEAAKAVIGDVYAFHESEAVNNPICERLLEHMLEMLQSTPGVDRIESQLLMFPSGAFARQFRDFGFRSFPRLFMSCDLQQQHTSAPTGHTFQPWQPSFYDAAADLIHRSYLGHMDSQINDQYQSVHGAQRFLHNIIRFPGCGHFDPENSWVLRDRHTAALQAIILCSRIRSDVNHITQLCVAPQLRGTGIGESLLQHCAAHNAARGIRSLSLTVTEANVGALQLYERNGFTPMHHFEAMVWNKSRASSRF